MQGLGLRTRIAPLEGSSSVSVKLATVKALNHIVFCWNKAV